MKSPFFRRTLHLVSSAAVVGGLMLLFFNGKDGWYGIRSVQWPETEGFFIEKTRERSGAVLSVRVKTGYLWKNVLYTTTRIRFGEEVLRGDGAKVAAAAEALGARPRVRVNPDQPEMAALLPGLSARTALLLGAGLLALAGGVGLFMGIRRR